MAPKTINMICYFISLVSQQFLEGRYELQIRGRSDIIVSTQLIQEPNTTKHHNNAHSTTSHSHFLDCSLVLWWKCLQMDTTDFLSSSDISISCKKLLATNSKASSGHAYGKDNTHNVQHMLILTWNQSIVQQLIREGNCLRRFLNASPMGLIAKTMCRFSRHRLMKKLNKLSGVNSASLYSACASGLTALEW